MRECLERLLGAPVVLEELKHKPGRRRTLRASGASGRAIVKIYASGRAPTVAARVARLAGGPAEPCVPRVLAVDEWRHALVLSEVPGRPLREAILQRDRAACQRVGEVLSRWHEFWRGRPPSGALRAHTTERELGSLHARLERAPPLTRALGAGMFSELGDLSWPLDTIVHRDLYEEQILLGEHVGLIDLDDAAIGPAELDVGNLCAHMRLLGHRSGLDLDPMEEALLQGYEAGGRLLSPALLARCRALSLLRLSCIHRSHELLACSELTAGAA